jgi:sugar/nucleoside kinase (ribokinase family)/sugar phosphate isomerase/epimerase
VQFCWFFFDSLRNIFYILILPTMLSLLLLFLLLSCGCFVADCTSSSSIVVVGSINADTFVPVARLPAPGENILANGPIVADVPGGKGCTQAVAARKLLMRQQQQQEDHQRNGEGAAAALADVAFLGQFGKDAVAASLRNALEGVNLDFAGHCNTADSGRGYVFVMTAGTGGEVCAVVSGGSNMEGWGAWKEAMDTGDCTQLKLDAIFGDNCQYVMLQREIPEYVNYLVAKYCSKEGIVVVQDIGGDDRPMESKMLRLCEYIVPNETELRRLVSSLNGRIRVHDEEGEGERRKENVVDMARQLQQHGARNVLVTLGSLGSTLVCEDGSVLHQPAIPVPVVVDETGAGDCYRAAFVVALQEGMPLQDCMEFASAAGACSVTRQGAVPSTPTRVQVEARLQQYRAESVLKISRGDGLRGGGRSVFPFLIGSRLNSMKDRPEVWDGPLLTPADWVKRQATVDGLTCVDFNYPQHFHTWSSYEAKAAVDEAGLVAGAVCLRYPANFARGAMNNPDAALRREAIQLTKEAAQVAIDLGCNEVVVWSAYDGYDYPFQVEYDTKWQELVDAFRECCDAFPDIRFSLEYKPTDENTRFFTVPSTGAAMLFVNEVDRANFGLTLDVGHMLMSGENPAQSIAMVGRAGKLFGIQLNDGYTRLAAEDGMMFGSIHPSMALEIMYQLHKIGFCGHVYFDTFPQRTDPVQEAQYNIGRVKAFWAAALSIDEEVLQSIVREHDAVGALEIVNNALRQM